MNEKSRTVQTVALIILSKNGQNGAISWVGSEDEVRLFGKYALTVVSVSTHTAIAWGLSGAVPKPATCRSLCKASFPDLPEPAQCRRLRRKKSLRGKLRNSKSRVLLERGLQSMMLRGWVLFPALGGINRPRGIGAGKTVVVGLGWF